MSTQLLQQDDHLPDHLHRWLEAALTSVQRQLQSALAAQIERIGVRRLRVLQLVPAEGARQQELAQIAAVTKQSVAESITVLESEGLIERRPDPDDRRAWLIVPTTEGRRAQAAMDQALVEVEAQVARAVGPDRYSTFRAVLRSIAELQPISAA
jgi:DNA-binding MarR family transcriptional regulator